MIDSDRKRQFDMKSGIAQQVDEKRDNIQRTFTTPFIECPLSFKGVERDLTDLIRMRI